MILNLKRKISKRSLIFYFICLYSLNTFLLLLVLAQGILAGFLITNKVIPVPGFVLKNLEENLADYGLYAKADDLHFDLLGRVTARRLKILKAGGGELLGQFDSLKLTLDLPLLLMQRVSVDSFIFQNGSLICPAFYSNSGVPQTLAEKIHGQFRRQNNGWEIERFDFKFQNLRAHAKGSWPQAGFTLPRGPLAEPAFRPRPLERYLFLCRQVLELSSKLQALENPVAGIALSYTKGERPKARFQLSGNSLQGPAGLNCGLFRLEIPRIDMPRLELPEPIYLRVDNLNWENRVKASDCEILLFADKPKNLLSAQVERARFTAGRLDAGGLVLMAPGGEISAPSFPLVNGSVQGLLQNRLVRLSGDFNLDQLSGQLSLDSRAALTEELRAAISSRLGKAAALERLILFSPPRLRLNSHFEPGFIFKKAEFNLKAGPLDFGGANFLRFAARGQVVPDEVQLTHYVLEKRSERVDGSLVVDLKQGDYQLLLAGEGDPVPLNPIMPDWWDNVWKNIEFSEYLLRSDLEAKGNWKTNRLNFFYGGFNGENVTFHSTIFETYDLKCWSRPGFIEIFDLHATRPEGKVEGSVNWVFLERKAVARILDLETSIHLGPLSALLGPEVAAVVGDFHLSTPARLHLKGNLYFPTSPWQIHRKLRLQAVSEEPFKYRQYPLDYLQFEAHFEDDLFDMDQIRFGFAGGDGTGHLTWGALETDLQLDMKLSLRGADHLKAFDLFGLNTTNKGDVGNRDEPIDGSPIVGKGIGKSGLLDVDFSAVGVHGDILSFTGLGSLKITQAELGTVHFFGGLSRALYGTWVDFTTLKLDSADCQFFLNENLIQFPEVNFSGPGSLISANGNIVMPDHNLDFKVRVNFFESEEKSLLSVLGPLLNPLESALELHLRGTLDNPRWRFQIDPRNVFSNPDPQRSRTDKNKDREMLLPPLGPPIEDKGL